MSKYCWVCGYNADELIKEINDLEANKNQKAIECLKEIREILYKERYPNQYGDVVDMITIDFYIYDKIKELEENKNEKMGNS